MSSTDPKWVKLQEKVRLRLEKIDGWARITSGSGSVKGNGDVISERFMVECKQRSRKNIIIEQNHWNKIKEEAGLLLKIPLIACENDCGEIIISMNLGDFNV